ncbi:hypothetical protein ACFQZC_18360 [Streptacidiphilus monticola]
MLDRRSGPGAARCGMGGGGQQQRGGGQQRRPERQYAEDHVLQQSPSAAGSR